MSDSRSNFRSEDDQVNTGSGDGDRLTNDVGQHQTSDVEVEAAEGQSLIDQAKEMARRDWESQYDDPTGDSASGGEDATSNLNPTDLISTASGSFNDAQSEVDSSVTGDRAGLGGTIGDPTSDFDSKIHNKQAGLGGAIGVPNDNLGGTFGDDQIHAGGEFNDSRGGIGSANPQSGNLSDAGLVMNDMQGAVDMNPVAGETRLDDGFNNVESTLSGGLGDEGSDSGSGSKFDSVRSEVERNFSDVAGTVDSTNPEWHSSNNPDTTATPADSGDLQFADTGVVDDTSTRAGGFGERARDAGMSLKQRTAEARDEASQRLEDVRHGLHKSGEQGGADGKSMIEDVQDKAKGLLNKVKDVFDGDKKS